MATMSAAQKARLQHLYVEAATPYHELVAESGLSRFGFQKLVKDENWGARPVAAKVLKPKVALKPGLAESTGSTQADEDVTGNVAGAGGDAEAPDADDASPGSKKNTKKTKKKDAPTPTDLVKQVLGTIKTELGKLKGQSGTSSQDRERGSRALSQLMNTLEKAVKMHKKVAKKRGDGKQDKETLKDAEAMRRQIAERLERLHRERLAAK